MKCIVINLHSSRKLIPSKPAGRLSCDFCHQPRPKKYMITGQAGTVICFECVALAVRVLETSALNLRQT